METLETIMTRRSVAKMSDRLPEREEIELLLRAAVRAPSHHLTQPWRFVVLTGDALDGLGKVMAERVRAQHAGDPNLERRVEVERARPRRAPVIVTVVYIPSNHPLAIEREDRYSVGALIENFLLAAHARGLACYLRTGPAAEHEGVREWFGLREREEIAGFIYLGYGSEDKMPPLSTRSDPGDRTEWRGFD